MPHVRQFQAPNLAVHMFLSTKESLPSKMRRLQYLGKQDPAKLAMERKEKGRHTYES